MSVGIDVLSVTAFDVDRGGVVHVERQAGRDAPSLRRLLSKLSQVTVPSAGSNVKSSHTALVDCSWFIHRLARPSVYWAPAVKVAMSARLMLAPAPTTQPRRCSLSSLSFSGSLLMSRCARNDQLVAAGDIILQERAEARDQRVARLLRPLHRHGPAQWPVMIGEARLAMRVPPLTPASPK